MFRRPSGLRSLTKNISVLSFFTPEMCELRQVPQLAIQLLVLETSIKLRGALVADPSEGTQAIAFDVKSGSLAP